MRWRVEFTGSIWDRRAHAWAVGDLPLLRVKTAALTGGGNGVDAEEPAGGQHPAGILLELWDESVTGDPVIAKAVVPMPPVAGSRVALQWVKMQPQGELQVAVFEA